VVEMKNNVLIINGHQTAYQVHTKPLRYNLPKDEQSLAVVATESLDNKAHAVMALPSQPALRTFGPIEVPAGQYLMLGDNRDNSGDSRYFGLVARQQIVGRVERVLVSWDKEDFYKPRFERFFQQLT
jgi:signal peptidase I